MAEPKLLTRGANIPLPRPDITASVEWKSQEKAGVYACLIGTDGLVRSAQDINPGHPRAPKSGGKLGSPGPARVSYDIDVATMPANVARIIFYIVAGDPARARCGALGIRMLLGSGGETVGAFELPGDLHLEAAAILGELYRRGDQWKFRAVGQGFTDGLDPLAKFIGSTPHDLRTAYLPANGATQPMAAPPPAPAPRTPPPPPPPPRPSPSPRPAASPKPPPASPPPPPPTPPPTKARPEPPKPAPPPRRRETAPPPSPPPAPGEEASGFTSGYWVLTSAGVQPLPGVELRRDELIKRELLDVRPDAEGQFWPSQFAHQPVSGEPLPPTPRFRLTAGRALGLNGLPELDEVASIDPDSRQDEQVPEGARYFVSGGTPPRLVAIDPNDGQAWWKAPWSDQWVTLGRCPRGGHLPPFASGALGTVHGVFYAAEDGLVHLLPEQQPRFVHLPVTGESIAAPAVVAGSVLLPVASGDGFSLAVRSADGSVRELPVAGSAGAKGPLGPPVVNAETGMSFWPGVAGFLVFEEGLDGPSCAWRAWPSGVQGLPLLRPYRSANGRLWAMAMETGPGGANGRALACVMAASGSREKQTLLGPAAAVGSQSFRSRSRHGEPWREAVEEIHLGFDHEGCWVLPLLRLGRRQTILGLVDGGGSAREFLFREGPPQSRQMTLALHSDHGPLAMLSQGWRISSTDDLELFLDAERLCIRHSESNQCASWSISFSR